MKRLVILLSILISFACAYGALLNEGFDGTAFPPAEWTSPATSWIRNTATPHSSPASARCGYSSGTWWLVTPKLKPTDGANTLTFWYKDYSSSSVWDSDDEYTHVLVSTSTDFSEATILWTGDYLDFTDAWQQATIPLSAYNDTEIYIAFQHIATGGNYHYIDDVTGVDLAPFSTPPNPATVVSPANGANGIDIIQTLNWASGGGGPENYDVYCGTDPVAMFGTPVSPLQIGTTFDPDLQYGLTYYWAVNPHNINGYAYADPTGIVPWSFTTMPNPILTPPTVQDFSTFPPLNWTRWNGLLADPSSLTTATSGWVADGFGNVGTTGAARVNIYGTSVRYWLVTPPIDLSAAKANYQLEFDLALTKFGNTNPPDGTCLDDKFAVVISTDNGATWSSVNTLRQWDMAGSPYVFTAIPPTGQTVAIPLTGYTGLVKIGFYCESTVTGNGDNDLSIDNMYVREAPTSAEFTITPTSWDYGQVDTATSATKEFLISNTGSGTLTIQYPEITEGMAYFTITDQVDALQINAGDPPQSFTVKYQPTAVETNNGTITIIDDLGRVARTVSLTGEGYARPAGSTCDNPYPVTLPLTGFTGDTGLYGDDYESGWVNPSFSYLGGDDMVLQFTLDGPSTLQGTLTALTGDWVGMCVVNTCPDPVNPAPVFASAGSSSGTVANMNSAELPAGSYFLIISTWPTPQSFQFSLDLAAIPVSQDPIMTITEDYWDYGVAFLGLSNCTPHTFTATNTGKGIITIGAQPVISDPANFSIIGDTNQYPITLGANASADWTVKFHPTVLCGEKIATMTIMDDMKRNITLVSHNESDVGFSFTKSLNGQTVSAKQAVLTENKSGLAQPKESYAIGLRGFGNESVFEDYFETYTHLAQDLTPWTQYDGDATATYNLQVTVSGTSYTLVPQYTGSFIGLDYSSYVPEPGAAWNAYSGEKYAGCSAAIGQQNNDWLITPQLTFADNPRISFFAKSLTIDYGMENFMVLYSTTGNSYSDFAGNYLNPTGAESAPLDWTLFEYELPASCANTDVYLAIQCVSNDVFMLMIDDFVAGDEGGTPPPVPVELSSFTATLTGQCYVQLNWTSQTESQMMGYRVYRNTSTDQSTSITINQSLVPATNTSSTQTYSMVDNEVANGQTYYYWLEAVDFNSSSYHGPVSVTVNGNVPPVLPEITSMKNAYPNPFKANANIEVSLKAGETGTVTLYNVAGQTVRTFQVVEGIHNLAWDGKDSSGKACGSGIFFYRLTTPSFNQTRKLMLVK